MTVTALGSYSCKISAITLTATSVSACAHGLPTTPDIVALNLLAAGSNTSLQGGVAAVAGTTTVTFTNYGASTVGIECYLAVAHSIIK